MLKLRTFRPGGFWLVTGAAVLWGTIGVATQGIYNIDSTTSLFLNLMRMLIAAPLLLAICWRVVGRAMFHIRRRDFLIMLLTGTLLAVSQACYFAAIRDAGVTIATLLAICVAPLVVTVSSVLMKVETLNRRMIAALVCALVGSVLLVGVQPPDAAHPDFILGAIFGVISAAAYGGVIVCGRFLAADYHPLQVTSVTFLVGTFVLVVINLAAGIVPVHTATGWLLVLYLGLVPTALAYGLFQMGLRSVSGTAASIIGMLDPLVAALLAWLLFGEILSAASVVGAGLLLLSIILLSLDHQPVVLPDGSP